MGSPNARLVRAGALGERATHQSLIPGCLAPRSQGIRDTLAGLPLCGGQGLRPRSLSSSGDAGDEQGLPGKGEQSQLQMAFITTR